jgi:hypothetical protein
MDTSSTEVARSGDPGSSGGGNATETHREVSVLQQRKNEPLEVGQTHSTEEASEQSRYILAEERPPLLNLVDCQMRVQ